MEIRVLRQLFQGGMLLSATIVPVSTEPNRWLMLFEKANGGQERITKARSNIDKVYKRINGAITDAKEIGFQEVKIRLK